MLGNQFEPPRLPKGGFRPRAEVFRGSAAGRRHVECRGGPEAAPVYCVLCSIFCPLLPLHDQLLRGGEGACRQLDYVDARRHRPKGLVAMTQCE
jgi:hypothetical protein